MPFPITCTACGKTFSIADDVYERKVKGRVVTIKCKQCQAGIRIDDTHGSASADDAEPLSVAQPEPPPTKAAAPAPAAVAAPKADPAPIEAPKVEAPRTEVKAEAPKAQPAAAGPAAAAPKAQPAAAAAAAPKAQPVATASTPKAQPAAAAPKAQAHAPRSPTLLGIAAPKEPTAAGSAPTPTAAKAQPAAAAPRAQPVATGAPRAQPVAAAPRAQAAGATPKAPTATATPIVGVAGTAKGDAAKTPDGAAPIANPAEPAAASPSPGTEVLWAVDFPDGQDRELTAAQVKKELASGTINETTLVWREGMDEWKELGQVPELLSPAAAPAPKPASPAPQRAKAPSAPLLEPGAQRPRAPSSPGPLEALGPRPRAASSPVIPEPPAQRPRAPSAPVIAEPPAQRPRAPSAPALPAPAPILKTPPPFSPFDTPPQQQQPTLPNASSAAGRTPPAFPAAPAPAPAPIPAAPKGGFAPLGAMNPAEPLVPHPQLPIAALPQQSGVDEWPQAKSRTPLIVGIVIALLVVGGVIFFLTNSSDKPPPAAPISALPATAPTATHSSEPAATDSNPSPGSTSGTDSSSSRGAMDAPGSAPTATPNAGFAELFASGARHADEKRGVNGPTQRFDANAAKAALTAAAAGTASCREKGGPAGKATIVVTFEPSGNVSSATVSDAPFAGTSSGACIASAMKRATVPPFSGLPGTVTKTLSIQ